MIQIEQTYLTQLSKYRQEYDEEITKLQLHIKELEEANESHQGVNLIDSLSLKCI